MWRIAPQKYINPQNKNKLQKDTYFTHVHWFQSLKDLTVQRL